MSLFIFIFVTLFEYDSDSKFNDNYKNIDSIGVALVNGSARQKKAKPATWIAFVR